MENKSLSPDQVRVLCDRFFAHAKSLGTKHDGTLSQEYIIWYYETFITSLATYDTKVQRAMETSFSLHEKIIPAKHS